MLTGVRPLVLAICPDRLIRFGIDSDLFTTPEKLFGTLGMQVEHARQLLQK